MTKHPITITEMSMVLPVEKLAMDQIFFTQLWSLILYNHLYYMKVTMC